MNRDVTLSTVSAPGASFDVIIIGGGATGLGIAVDAASRGLSVFLAERLDFGQGTSSRSTKLVHGGVRYLKQGNVALVREALHERDVLRRNAPHLVHDLPFVIPCFRMHEVPFYAAGLKVYDLLAGAHSFGRSRIVARAECQRQVPAIQVRGLSGGVIYHDGQFDDARFLIALARTAAAHGALLLNYAKVTSLVREQSGRISGVVFTDTEHGEAHQVSAKVVINAGGPFVDEVRQLEGREVRPVTTASKGIHVVVDRSFLGGDTALMIPKTPDGRVLFAIPWHSRVIIGTTDTPIPSPLVEPLPLASEIDLVLETANRYLSRAVERRDILSTFAGVRPLFKPGRAVSSTAAVSREHAVLVSDGGLVTVTGGKWTTYRRMAADALDHALRVAGLVSAPCRTADLRLHGATSTRGSTPELAVYGTDASEIEALMRDPELSREIHPGLGLRAAEVVFAARFEMARTVEDVLSRRTRWLLLDARTAAEAAPAAAAILARELGRSPQWVREQTEAFQARARSYLPDGSGIAP